MAAFVHSPLQGPYTASKAGVWAMSNSIRLGPVVKVLVTAIR
ncbi:hypothetical protein [Streptomyces sp. NPDC051000]